MSTAFTKVNTVARTECRATVFAGGRHGAASDYAAEPEMVNRAGLDAPRQAGAESHMASW